MSFVAFAFNPTELLLDSGHIVRGGRLRGRRNWWCENVRDDNRPFILLGKTKLFATTLVFAGSDVPRRGDHEVPGELRWSFGLTEMQDALVRVS